MSAAHYDDPQFFYEQYWQDRQYEQQSEVIALTKLLPRVHFAASADIGGGFGRLTSLLTTSSDCVYLVEPSRKQLSLARKYLSSSPHVVFTRGTAEKTTLPDSSLDLAIVIRVFHHLPKPDSAFLELHRILKPGGLVVIEFANSLHFKSRLKSLFTDQPVSPSPIERRSESNIRRSTIPFVNHHPQTFIRTLFQSGLHPVTVLSVSNFRSPFIKKIIPLPPLLILESLCQKLLSRIFFGPSIFILARKT